MIFVFLVNAFQSEKVEWPREKKENFFWYVEFPILIVVLVALVCYVSAPFRDYLFH